MFNIRSREYKNKDRLILKLKEFSVSNDAIPLKENWAERWYSLTEGFEAKLPLILDFQVRDDDVFVVTYMKCGTTWMQETVWLLMHNLDYKAAKATGISERSPFMDWCGIFEHLSDSVEIVDKTPSPRCIKSHMPPNLLPKQLWEKKAKVIYVARNVKDTVVSSFHFIKDLGAWAGTIDEYVEDFINNEIIYLPYWTRVIDFYKMRNAPNVFFVTYEDMQRDLTDVIQRLCKFLGRNELTQEELVKAIDHLSFNKMKTNKQTNITEELKGLMPKQMKELMTDNFEFMRRGIIGSYKDELTSEDQSKLNAWSDEILAEHGLKQEDIFGKC